MKDRHQTDARKKPIQKRHPRKSKGGGKGGKGGKSQRDSKGKFRTYWTNPVGDIPTDSNDNEEHPREFYSVDELGSMTLAEFKETGRPAKPCEVYSLADGDTASEAQSEITPRTIDKSVSIYCPGKTQRILFKLSTIL